MLHFVLHSGPSYRTPGPLTRVDKAAISEAGVLVKLTSDSLKLESEAGALSEQLPCSIQR